MEDLEQHPDTSFEKDAVCEDEDAFCLSVENLSSLKVLLHQVHTHFTHFFLAVPFYFWVYPKRCQLKWETKPAILGCLKPLNWNDEPFQWMIYLLIKQGCIKLIKSNKAICNVTKKLLIKLNAVFFYFLFNPKVIYHDFQK